MSNSPVDAGVCPLKKRENGDCKRVTKGLKRVLPAYGLKLCCREGSGPLQLLLEVRERLSDGSIIINKILVCYEHVLLREYLFIETRHYIIYWW